VLFFSAIIGAYGLVGAEERGLASLLFRVSFSWALYLCLLLIIILSHQHAERFFLLCLGGGVTFSFLSYILALLFCLIFLFLVCFFLIKVEGAGLYISLLFLSFTFSLYLVDGGFCYWAGQGAAGGGQGRGK
jgi:hypothetical protein